MLAITFAITLETKLIKVDTNGAHQILSQWVIFVLWEEKTSEAMYLVKAESREKEQRKTLAQQTRIQWKKKTEREQRKKLAQQTRIQWKKNRNGTEEN